MEDVHNLVLVFLARSFRSRVGTALMLKRESYRKLCTLPLITSDIAWILAGILCLHFFCTVDQHKSRESQAPH